MVLLFCFCTLPCMSGLSECWYLVFIECKSFLCCSIFLPVPTLCCDYSPVFSFSSPTCQFCESYSSTHSKLPIKAPLCQILPQNASLSRQNIHHPRSDWLLKATNHRLCYICHTKQLNRKKKAQMM